MKHAILGLAALAAATVAAPQAGAYEVEPLAFSLGASGSSAKSSFQIKNTDSTPLPVEISVIRKSDESAADDAFLMFPPQAVVPANGAQAVRVQFLGGDADDYFFIVRQVPVKLEGQTGVGVNLTYRLPVKISR